jgi:transcriptional regulator with XRE-family HTH domain
MRAIGRTQSLRRPGLQGTLVRRLAQPEQRPSPGLISLLLSSSPMDGRILRYARHRAGLTQREVADRAQVPQPAIARIESGGVSPRLSTLLPLIEATGFALELAPRIGEGVDRTLIRSSLDRSPEERIRAATAAARNLDAFIETVRAGRA